MKFQNNVLASCRRMGVAHHVYPTWLVLDCFLLLLRRGTEQQAHAFLLLPFLMLSSGIRLHPFPFNLQ